MEPSKVKKRKIKRFGKKCLRCGYEWLSAIDRPKQCPGCKQTAWDRPARESKLNRKSVVEVKQDSIFDAIGKMKRGKADI